MSIKSDDDRIQALRAEIEAHRADPYVRDLREAICKLVEVRREIYRLTAGKVAIEIGCETDIFIALLGALYPTNLYGTIDPYATMPIVVFDGITIKRRP